MTVDFKQIRLKLNPNNISYIRVENGAENAPAQLKTYYGYRD